MKLPSPWIPALKTPLSVASAVGRSTYYTVVACTANLGASPSYNGHSSLKHCFTEIHDARRNVVASFAYGPSGMRSEPHPDHPSTRRFPVAVVTAPELQRVQAALVARGAQSYRWGENDCCSSLISAVCQDTGMIVPTEISQAALDIKHSPPLF